MSSRRDMRRISSTYMHFFNDLAESMVQNRTLPFSLGAMPKMAVELSDSLDALVLHDLPKALVGAAAAQSRATTEPCCFLQSSAASRWRAHQTASCLLM